MRHSNAAVVDPRDQAGPSLVDALDYASLANQHRPTDPARLAAAVRTMFADGLTPRDVAAALRLHLAAVIEIAAAQSSPALSAVTGASLLGSSHLGERAGAGDLFQVSK